MTKVWGRGDLDEGTTFSEIVTILPTIKLEIKGEFHYLALDPCSTHSFVSHDLASALMIKTLSPITLTIGTMNGELKKKYDRALIMLPNQKLPILVHIRKHFLSIQGYKHIYLDSLNKLCSSGALEQIRNNIPYKLSLIHI